MTLKKIKNKPMSDKIIYIIFGIMLIIYGVDIIYNPEQTWHGYPIDYTMVRIPYGLFIIVLGIYIIKNGIEKNRRKYEKEYYICPECEKIYEPKDFLIPICPECEVELEELEGFYNRHPELRKDDGGGNK